MDEGQIPIPYTKYKIDFSAVVGILIYIGVCYHVWFNL